MEGLAELWAETIGDSRVSVAVLDGPVDFSHPVLEGADLVQVKTLASASLSAGLSLDHGTHVVSLLFGCHDGPLKGICPGCRGLIIPIFEDAVGSGTKPCSQVDLARAILQASENGADIINISGGQPSGSGEAHPLLSDAVRECTEKGILIIAATGNRGCDCLDVPGALPSVLSVGAMDRSGNPLDFSNWGDKYRVQGILAPGEQILGARPGGGLVRMTGTSTAAPIVSGVAALLISLQLKRGIGRNSIAVRDAILGSALGCDHQGTLDCRRLLVGRLSVRGAAELLDLGEYRMIEPEGTRLSASDHVEPEDAQGSVVASGIPDGTPAVPSAHGVDGNSIQCSNVHEVSVVSEQSASVVPSVVPSACGCKGACGGARVAPPQLVYVIGKLGFDFGSRTRLDSLQFHADGDKDGNRLPITMPGNLLRHLFGWRETYKPDQAGPSATDMHRPHMYDAKAVIWVLTKDSTPVYAIQPSGSFAEAAYEELAGFLLDQEGLRDPQGNPLLDVDHTSKKPVQGSGRAEYVAIAGVISGSIRLMTGEVVPVIVPDMRGTASWSTSALVTELTKRINNLQTERVEEIIQRLYEAARNLGVTAGERAINYMATNVFDVAVATRLIIDPNWDLDEVTVQKSAVCRAESDCYDVEVSFFNPNNLMQAKRVTVTTIDVSDVVPVPVGERRTFTRR